MIANVEKKLCHIVSRLKNMMIQLIDFNLLFQFHELYTLLRLPLCAVYLIGLKCNFSSNGQFFERHTCIFLLIVH